MMARKSITWWVPWRYHCPRVIAEARKLVSVGMWLRIVTVTLGFVVLLEWLLNSMIAGLEVNLLGMTAKAILGMMASLGVVVLASCIPPVVTLDRKRISETHGQRTRMYPYRELSGLCLEMHAGFQVLKFVFKEKEVRVALGARVRTADVVDLLGQWGVVVSVPSAAPSTAGAVLA